MLSNIIPNNILSSASSQINSNAWNEYVIAEKKNLINLFKLVVKELIQSSNLNNKTIDSKSTHFTYFFDLLENILDHGIKNKSKYQHNYTRKEYNNLIDMISQKCDLNSCLNSIKEMKEIRTPIGKIRAWIKLSLMHKTLAQNFSLLIKEKEFIKENYENESILYSDEATLISGLLIGLNVYDVNIDLKSFNLNEFDLPIRPVNYSLYLRERVSTGDQIEHDEADIRINEIFDQKNYLEELNKSLEAKFDQFLLKYQSLEKTNTILNEKLAAFQNESIQLKGELEACMAEKSKLKNEFEDRTNQVNLDIQIERETFQNSKSCLDQMYIELQEKVLLENKLRTNSEAELQTQLQMKKELENKQSENNCQLYKEEVTNLKVELEICRNKSKKLIEKIEKLTIDLNDSRALSEETKNQLSSKEFIIKQQESDLDIEKNWRVSLQEEVSFKKDQLRLANSKIDDLTKVENNYKILLHEHDQLKTKHQELDYALEEMGAKLAHSQIMMDGFKEVNKQVSEFQWESDAVSCKICTKDFNLARRKHHCRRCGGIFCHECSDNKMPLPSSSKPVRVCEVCYQTLLQKTTK